ncbi:MAG: YIP1 family protein [Gammaproteobacteria bacterium]
MENEQQTSFNPYKSIWLQPRSTIQYIVDTNPTYLVLALLALTGVAYGISAASAEGWGYDMSLLWVFLIIAAIFPLITILLLYIVSGLTCWTGKWLGGKATQEQIRAAYAWSYIPIIATIALYVPLFMFYGFDLFNYQHITFSDPLPMVPAQSGVAFVIVAIAEVVLNVWSFVIALHCLGQVQGFSAWRALGNQALTALVLFVPIVVIIMIPVILFAVSQAY